MAHVDDSDADLAEHFREQEQAYLVCVLGHVERPGILRDLLELATWEDYGLFLHIDAFLGALAVHEPDMLYAAQQAMAKATRDGARILPDADAFAASPAESVDYAVMEKAERVAMVPVSMGWSDLGSWDALHDISDGDAAGNVHKGEVIAIETENCLVQADGVRVALVGVSDLIVVANGKEVLVMPRGRSQEVKRLIEAMKD